MTEYFVGPCPDGAEGFLYNTYIKSYWDMGGVRAQLRYSEHCDMAHRRLEELLGRKPILLVLSARETPRWFGGWLLAEVGGVAPSHKLCVHWCYVKHPFRKRGYATTLLDEALRIAGEPEHIVATHDIPRWRPVLTRKGIALQPLGELLARHPRRTA